MGCSEERAGAATAPCCRPMFDAGAFAGLHDGPIAIGQLLCPELAHQGCLRKEARPRLFRVGGGPQLC